MTRVTKPEFDEVTEKLERRGILERIGFRPGKDGKPQVVWRARDAARKILEDEMKRDLASTDKWVLEIRNGVVLFLNERVHASEEDGWWWGTDERAITWGPFESSEAAVEDACMASDEPIKIVTRDDTEMKIPEAEAPPAHTDGFVTINVVDTKGHIWLKTGEKPAAQTPKSK
jgi:hypothetical protein